MGETGVNRALGADFMNHLSAVKIKKSCGRFFIPEKG
jgi:hypothetical protein